MDVVPINRPLVGLDGGWASHNSIPVIKTCMASTNLNAEEKQLNIPEDKQVNNQRSAQSETPRDGQNRQSGKAAATKRRRVAPPSPGAANGGEA